MPGLNAIFRLTDNYSSAINNITRNSERAYSAINQTSAATDKVSSGFTSASNSTNGLISKLTGLAAAYLTVQTAEQAMNISDTYINTNSRLALITSSLKQQKQLQNEIYAAANRSRGTYTTMADNVAKLGIIAGEKFGSNANIVKFAETLQKIYKISGTPTANQSGANLQIQQAIGMGRLQGQDLRILSDDAPLVEKAIAQYMGKSTGAIKKLGTEGKITSQVLIDSILAYSKTTNSAMKSMPYTFGDVWNKITNGATQKFGKVFTDISKTLNSKGFNDFVNGVVGAFGTLAIAADNVLKGVSGIAKFFTDNWSVIKPIILGVAAVLTTVWIVTKGIAIAQAIWTVVTGIWDTVMMGANIVLGLFTGVTDAAADAQVFFNSTLLACPLTWIIILVIAAIASLYIIVAVINKIKGSTISATGVIVGSIYWIGALFKNVGLWIADVAIGIWDVFLACINNIKVAFGNAWANIQMGWLAFQNIILTGIKTIIDWLDKIPGVSIKTGSISNEIVDNVSKIAKLYAQKKGYTDVGSEFSKGMNTYKVFQKGWSSDAYNAGYKIGSKFEKSIGKTIKSFESKLTGTKSNPTTVKGTGSSGSVTVNIADQDLQYLRDLAEKDYINKFSTAVLSPKISVKVSNGVATESNAQVAKRMSKIMREEIATAAEGNY